ncbi:LysE family translocator [Sneathiella glossodoripedis]|uniref:LysE family translocator n=1 Tax=Sneathiella glossodoripedis TaxID=418853 RepID=UPI00046F27D5|nr:LysE family translocator [Sneathiella glossodoripedis]
MLVSEILTFVFVASLLVMSPGPNGVLIAKTVPTSGKVAGFANIAGFMTGFYLHGALSVLGISIILVQSATAFTLVKILGAIYLCWIGIKALIDAFSANVKVANVKPVRRKRTLLKAYSEGLLTNALNPKVSMFYLAAFPQFISSDAQSAVSAFILVFLHSVINLLWFGAMVLVLSRLGQVAKTVRFQKWLKALTGVVFIGFGLKLASYSRNA